MGQKKTKTRFLASEKLNYEHKHVLCATSVPKQEESVQRSASGGTNRIHSKHLDEAE